MNITARWIYYCHFIVGSLHFKKKVIIVVNTRYVLEHITSLNFELIIYSKVHVYFLIKCFELRKSRNEKAVLIINDLICI